MSFYMHGKEVSTLPVWKFWDKLRLLEFKGEEQTLLYSRAYLLCQVFSM